MTIAQAKSAASEPAVVAVVERAASAPVAAPWQVEAFHQMIRGRDADRLDCWLSAPAVSPVASFVKEIAADKAAVSAAIAPR